MSKPLKLTLQLLFGGAVLAWLIHTLGADQLWQACRRVPASVWLGGMLAYLLAQLFSAWRWQLISRLFGFHASFFTHLRLYFLGMFYNLFLPTGYGGDVVKVLSHAPTRQPPSRMFSAITIFLDRLAGLLALLLWGALAAWAQAAGFSSYGDLLGGLLLFCILLAVGLLRPLSHWPVLPRRIRCIFLILRAHGARLWPVGLLSLVIQGLNVLIYAYIFAALGASLSLSAVALGYSLVTLATLLPLSVGGLGVREAGWAGLMVPLGAPAALGVSAGLIYFALQTFSSLFGLLALLSSAKDTHNT